MKYTFLEKFLKNTDSYFICEMLNQRDQTKIVKIEHLPERAHTKDELEEISTDLGHINGLMEFYSKYGGLRLYCDAVSGDSAFYLASPYEWDNLGAMFDSWLDAIEDELREEYIPNWVEQCVVIGDVPSSGNYFLLIVDGELSGNVFQFEHDGFEFIKMSDSFPEFIKYMCEVTPNKLREMASHMRFIESDSLIQWWIREYHVSKDDSPVVTVI